jgi:hypothetical protein
MKQKIVIDYSKQQLKDRVSLLESEWVDIAKQNTDLLKENELLWELIAILKKASEK